MNNMESLNEVTRILAAIGGCIAGLYGGWSGSMTVLVVFMIIDYATGCFCALSGKSKKTDGGHFWSSVAFAGLVKKAAIMLIMLMAVMLDRAVGNGTSMFQTAAAWFYVANEGLSIVENCGLLGVPVPEALKNALEVLRDKGDKGEDDKAE